MARRSSFKKRGRKTSPKTQRLTVEITGFSHRGHGIAEIGDGKIYVPNSLPGEVTEIEAVGEQGRVISMERQSAERKTPICQHFETCGGCSLQHLDTETYEAFKTGLIEKALKARGLNAPIRTLAKIPLHSRRRASFVATRTGKNIVLGFHEERSRKVVHLNECPVLAGDIENALPILKDLVAPLIKPGKDIRLQVLSSENGMDIRLDGFGDWPSFETEQKLIQMAMTAKLARLSLGADLLIEPKIPTLTFGTVNVKPPAGGFVQATGASEDVMVKNVVEALNDHSHILELFAGSGTFSFHLAKHARIHAVEGDEAALNALITASKRTADLKPITTEHRDLFIRPFMVKELTKFKAVVLDPPRTGAFDQCVEIGQSDIETVVYVSCSPASFARDARQLVDDGFELLMVQPVDQFVFSHHIEIVSVFRRG